MDLLTPRGGGVASRIGEESELVCQTKNSVAFHEGWNEEDASR